jgi:hypothetical protein
MKHLEEAELVEHYYEESANMGESERHLKACPVCAKQYAELCRDPRRSSHTHAARAQGGLREQVWQSIDASSRYTKSPKAVGSDFTGPSVGQPPARCWSLWPLLPGAGGSASRPHR